MIPQKRLDKLPPPEPYEKVKFPTEEQKEKATAQIQEEWGPKVAG